MNRLLNGLKYINQIVSVLTTPSEASTSTYFVTIYFARYGENSVSESKKYKKLINLDDAMTDILLIKNILYVIEFTIYLLINIHKM